MIYLDLVRFFAALGLDFCLHTLFYAELLIQRGLVLRHPLDMFLPLVLLVLQELVILLNSLFVEIGLNLSFYFLSALLVETLLIPRENHAPISHNLAISSELVAVVFKLHFSHFCVELRFLFRLRLLYLTDLTFQLLQQVVVCREHLPSLFVVLVYLGLKEHFQFCRSALVSELDLAHHLLL